MTAIAHVGGPADQKAPPLEDNVQRRRLTPYWLLLPGLAWLTVFFVIPMVFLASQSLQTGSLDQGYALTWHIQTYVDALKNYYPQFVRSLGYAATATIFALIIAYPLAYAIAFKSGRWKNILLVLVIAPFFTSFLIRTLAWQTILTDGGPVVGFFRDTKLIWVLQQLHLTNNNSLLASKFAVIAGLTYNFLPFM